MLAQRKPSGRSAQSSQKARESQIKPAIGYLSNAPPTPSYASSMIHAIFFWCPVNMYAAKFLFSFLVIRSAHMINSRKKARKSGRYVQCGVQGYEENLIVQEEPGIFLVDVFSVSLRERSCCSRRGSRVLTTTHSRIVDFLLRPTRNPRGVGR